MRKLFAFLVFALTLQTLAFAQCPDPGVTGDGFHPPSDSLDCAERGLAFNEVIQANIPNTISTPLGAVTVTSIVINDVQGEPTGISHSCTPSNCTFNGGTTGCLEFSGTTNDPVGVYRLSFTVTVSIIAPLLGAQTFGPENLDTLVASLPFQIPLLSGIVYELKVTEQGGPCPPVDPISVTVSADPPAICRGESTVFTATVTNGSGNQTYLWSSGVTDSSFTTTPVGGGGYSVTVIDNGDTVTASGSVIINDLPVAAFTLSDTAMPTITFDNTSTGATSYAWDFDDGSTGVDADPVHVYDENGTFTVQLVATNSCGSDTTTSDVTITGVFIGTLESDLEFSVYPNPSEGIFTISLAGNSGSPATINIFDQSGKRVFSETLSGTVQKQMNLTDLPKGIYTLHLNSEKSNGVQKLVIR